MPKVGMEPIRREQIQKAAARLISKQGFIRTTIADVAKAAGASTGMIHHYYRNKTDLLIETLNYISALTQEKIRAACNAEPDPLQRLKVLARTSISDKGVVVTSSRIWAWAIAEAMLSKEMAALLRRRRNSYQELLRETIAVLVPEEGIPESDLVALAAEMDAYLTGLTIYMVSGGEHIDPRSVEQSLTAMVMRSIPTGRRDEATLPVA